MCGIAGIVGELDSELEACLERMLTAQTHRGPDDSGVFRGEGNPSAIFGFRRLAILDLTLEGHQPMVDRQRGNVVVFNGEIYNFASLKAELEASGEVFRSKCDTEVLLNAYGRYGAEAIRKLRGMFAFAIYDPRQRTVTLARDRLGIKPLYYAELQHRSRRVLLFSSELRSLLATKLFDRRLDPTSLSSYMWNGFVVGPNTIVRGITMMAAGTSMTIDIDTGKSVTNRYWSLGPRSSKPAELAKEELEHQLLTAARQHLVSDVPLGIFLSGGVDSSAVAALAMRSGQGRVKTFHIGFDETEFDESQYARAVANSLGTEHAEFRLTQSLFVAQLDQALSSLDQPTLDGINTYFVSRVVREAGFTVALAGTGGDELFGGYSSFPNMLRARRMAPLAKWLPTKGINRLFNTASKQIYARKYAAPPQTRWAKLGALLGAGADRLNVYQVFYGLFTPEFLAELEGETLSSLTGYGLTAECRSELEASASGLTDLSANSVYELALFLRERLLRDSDAASMAVSLELRVPLLDHEVVEAVQRVPDSLRYQPLGKKQLLKALAMPNLDPSIFDRPKAGFVLPIAVWAKDKLAKEIESTFSSRDLVESVGLRSDVLQRLWKAFLSGAPGMYWSRVWAPYVLLNWCRTHEVSL